MIFWHDLNETTLPQNEEQTQNKQGRKTKLMLV